MRVALPLQEAVAMRGGENGAAPAAGFDGFQPWIRVELAPLANDIT